MATTWNVYRKPALGHLLPDRAELKDRLGALDKQERSWIHRAALRSEVPEEPELARLVAGVAWQALTALAWAWTALAVFFVLAVLLANVFLPYPGVFTGAAGVFILAAVQLFVARRYAGTLALVIARHGPFTQP